ncbi:MAG: NAD-dependent epimerase/dehydratase family protein, partial [Candidatus Niyogibacteria bacterium]|nr:NAD-dependent epimerase/dehydratase family protein [Candidatus Niyogibacteria bacterium]
VLVTGGLGFVGSHIVDACVARGDSVFSADDLHSGKRENANPKAPNFQIDVSDISKLEGVFREVQPEVVFHCAALARIQPSFQNPERYFEVNAIGTKNVLKLAKDFKTRRVVYSASSSAYGDQPEPALREGMKLTAQSLHPYGSTKRMGEMLMRDMGRVTGGPETVCLRYFNVYGPRQTATADGPYATVVGIFLDKARKGEALTVVPDGAQKRDFTWVGDVAGANLLAGSSLKVGDGEIINIGSGKNHSVWGVASLVLGLDENTPPEELLKSGKCVMAPPRRGEVRETLADISLARNLLGWQPEVSFEEGINLLKSKFSDPERFRIF